MNALDWFIALHWPQLAAFFGDCIGIESLVAETTGASVDR